MRCVLALIGMLALSGSAIAADAPLGRWLTASGNLVIEIAPCGPMICGKVVEIRANRSMEAAGREVAAKPALGMTILSDFVSDGGGTWQGHIFNRENGKTYDCLISIAGPRELKVRPYIFVSLIGRTQIWKKV